MVVGFFFFLAFGFGFGFGFFVCLGGVGVVLCFAGGWDLVGLLG